MTIDTCILISRKLVDSEIWNKPPLYLKVWIYLLVKAQHSDYKKLKKGQLYTSIPEIQDGCSWYSGYRKEAPTKDQVFQILDWLRNPYGHPHGSNDTPTMGETMIATTRATHGIIVTITNYCFYQDIKNYGSNGVSNNESNNGNDTDGMREQRQPDNINKNDKNDNNIPPIIPQGDEHTKLFEKTSNPYRCASFLDNAISERLPERKRAIEQQLQKWADAFDKAKRIDGYSWELIGYLLEKSQEDDFWQKNILSGATFRKQIEKLYAKFGDEK